MISVVTLYSKSGPLIQSFSPDQYVWAVHCFMQQCSADRTVFMYDNHGEMICKNMGFLAS